MRARLRWQETTGGPVDFFKTQELSSRTELAPPQVHRAESCLGCVGKPVPVENPLLGVVPVHSYRGLAYAGPTNVATWCFA